SNAQKASHKIKRDQKTEAARLLHDTITIHLDDQKIKIDSLSHAHNVTPKYINNMINSHTKYHTMCKVQLTNTLIHAKAKEVNAGKLNPLTPHHLKNLHCNQINLLVTNDPQMKKLTKDKKAAYIAALTEHHEQKVTHVQGNNLATARDVLLMAERVVKELNDLCVRTGTYTTLFVICGHVNDMIQSTMHGTNNSEDFWEDI
ncbi:hypothetical protein EDB19DRAFT_1611071, partial [Suillus lakei]